MKALLITIVSFLAPLVLIGQVKTEFALQLSATQITLEPGETKTVLVNIVRSKGYAKYKAKLGFSSPTPDGISLSYETAQGFITASTLTITASNNAKEDSYMVLPNCVLNNKTKSTALKLIVKADASVSRGD
jgi:hypothetical protein